MLLASNVNIMQVTFKSVKYNLYILEQLLLTIMLLLILDIELINLVELLRIIVENVVFFLLGQRRKQTFE